MKFLNHILCFLFFFSCGKINQDKNSINLIEPDLMEKIMQDVLLMKNIKRNNYASSEKKHFLVDQYILEKYGIDSIEFMRAQEYYSKNPKEYLPIFNKIKIKLLKLKDSIQKAEKE